MKGQSYSNANSKTMDKTIWEVKCPQLTRSGQAPICEMSDDNRKYESFLPSMNVLSWRILYTLLGINK